MSQSTINPVHLTHLCGIALPSTSAQHKSKELTISKAVNAWNQVDIEQAVLTAQSSLWKNGQVLDYSFFGGSPDQHTKVEDVIQEWTWYANVIFSRSTPNNRDATLRIAFDPTKGSWSYVGSTAKSCDHTAPTMNLAWIADNDTLTREERGIILHEFGHALGLMHEHESPARSGVIRLKEAEVLKYYTETQGWDENTVRKQILDVYSREAVSNYNQIDPTSIMTYFMPAAMNEGGVDIPEITELSMLDKAFAVAIYPRDRPHPRAHQWTPQFALMAMGASLDAITLYAMQKDIDVKRNVFRREMVELRLHEAKRMQLQAERKVPRASSSKPIMDQYASRIPSDTERLQNDILSLLFNIAPKVLLTPKVPTSDGAVDDIEYASLNSSNITLEHPLIHRGLVDFFMKLASNETMKKVITGAVKFHVSALSHTEGTKDTVQSLTYVERVQNRVLSLLLSIAPKDLLAPSVSVTDTTTKDAQHAPPDPDSLTLEHPAVQQSLLAFFEKLTSNEIVKKVMFRAGKFDAEPTIREETHTEKVQNKILSLLFGIAPKVLLVPNTSTDTSTNGVRHTPLDLNNLSLEHPSVQRGLMNFFMMLMSNEAVVKAMTGAIELSGGALRVGHTTQERSTEEKLQNHILSLLFGIAPKALLSQNVSLSGSTANDGQQMPLDVYSLTLEHPIVQHGLMAFLEKLTSNKVVKKVTLRAVGINVESLVLEETHVKKVQNSVLSLLLDIAPKVLLVPNMSTNTTVDGVQHAPLDPDNISLEHPIIRRGLTNFFMKLMSNKTIMESVAGAVELSGNALAFKRSLPKETYEEKVENHILSLLFDIAPKTLLDPNVSTPGTIMNGGPQAPLDVNSLTLEHPIVQNRLTGFFEKLMSNEVIKKIVSGTIKVNAEPTIKEESHTEKVQNGVLSLLLDIAPKVLLVPNTSITRTPDDVRHIPLGLDDLSLDHPVIQRGLLNFFMTLMSNEIVKKAMTGAVELSGGLARPIVSPDKRTDWKKIHEEKVQNHILSLLFNIAPKDLLVPDAPTNISVNNFTLDHPIVQRGLVSFFGKLTSNETVMKTMVGVTKLASGVPDVETTVPKETHTEKVQNGILSLLFGIAPKVLLVPNTSTGVQNIPLDPNNLSLKHPAVQRGLTNFFMTLMSDEAVMKAMMGAVELTGGMSLVKPTVQKVTHKEKVQNYILSLLFTLAPKDLLVPTVSTHGSIVDSTQYETLDLKSLTLDHPIVQHGVMNFFERLTSNRNMMNAMAGAIKLAGGSVDRPGVESIQKETLADRVQSRILSLLFNIAPKTLLSPTVSMNGSVINGNQNTALDPNDLTLEHPTVQHCLMSFFTKLASSEIIKKTMVSAVGTGAATLDRPDDVKHGLKTNTSTISDDQLAHIISLLVADSRFKGAVSAMCGGRASDKADESSLSEYTVTVTKKSGAVRVE